MHHPFTAPNPEDMGDLSSARALAYDLGVGKSHVTTRVMGTFGYVFSLMSVDVHIFSTSVPLCLMKGMPYSVFSSVLMN